MSERVGRRWIGRWILTVGVLHALLGIGTFLDSTIAVVREGLWNTVAGVQGRPLAFWFIAAGFLVALVGALTNWIEARSAPPRFLGWTLLAFAVGGSVLVPVSGFWLLLPPAVALVGRRQLAVLPAVLPLLAMLTLLACTSRAPARVSTALLMSDRISFQLAVYYLSPPKGDPIAGLDRLLATEFPGLQRIASAPASTGKGSAARTVVAHLITDVQASYAPPDLDSLRYRGEGLNEEQTEALQRAPAALVLDFSHGKEHVWDGLRGAMELAGRIARDSGGMVWDVEGRKVLTPEKWDRKSLAAWQAGSVADCRQLFNIDAYKDGEYLREVTLGMKKLGLPDLVAEELPASLYESTGNLINTLAQALAEGGTPGKAGELDLSLRSLQNAEVRTYMLGRVLGQGRGEARLTLTWANPEEGDPDNRLLQIGFGRYPGKDLHAQQEALIVDFWGAEKDEITHVEHDDKVLAASRKARESLPALRAAFQAGLEPGEMLLVKAPFPIPDGGREWMWVEVTAWKGDAIRGVLRNEPTYIPDLQAGQEVEVSEKDVLDYKRKLPDGRVVEGDVTAAAIKAAEKRPVQ